MTSFPTFDPSRLTKKAAAQYSSESEEEDDDDFRAPVTDPSQTDFSDFNPRKRRRVGNTKERAALGIFASDSEDDGPAKRWKKKSLRGQAMSFVSTGPTTVDEDEDMEEDKEERNKEYSDDDDDAPDDEADDEEDARGVGLGFGGAQRGLGFMPARKEGSYDGDTTSTPVRSFPKTKFDGKSTLGRGFVPSSSNIPVLNPDIADTPTMPKMDRPSAFGANGAKGKPNPKSFGARMMAKMGYKEGEGLGKEAQGRSVIIEAHLRPQGVGLGAVKEKSEHERKEEKRQAKLRGEVVVDSDEEEKKKKRERKRKTASAGNSNVSTPKRQKPRYMTAEEIKKSAPGLHIPEAFAPILDMTGPGNKVLTSTAGLMTPTSSTPAEPKEGMAARKARADMEAFTQEWADLDKQQTWVDRERRELEQEVADLASRLERCQAFTNMATNELPSATEWPDVIRCLNKAIEQAGSLEEEMVNTVISAIRPFLRDPDWNLLEQPTRFTTELKGLKPSLTISGEDGMAVDEWGNAGLNNSNFSRQNQKMTSYETMIYQTWYKRAVSTLNDDWDVFDPTPLLAVLDAWNDLLPPRVRAYFINDVIRKLQETLADWNPKKRQNHKLPHLWLFPWLQYLPSDQLEPKGTTLIANVQRRYRDVIKDWDFARGVIPGLKQLLDVLSYQGHEVPGYQRHPLIMSHVLPAMGRDLRKNFRVDPSNQEHYLPTLAGVLKWSAILKPEVLGEVVVAEVFPLWHEMLVEWLGMDEVNYVEVGAWMEWWRKGVFPDRIQELESINVEFNKAFPVLERELNKWL